MPRQDKIIQISEKRGAVKKAFEAAYKQLAKEGEKIKKFDEAEAKIKEIETQDNQQTNLSVEKQKKSDQLKQNQATLIKLKSNHTAMSNSYKHVTKERENRTAEFTRNRESLNNIEKAISVIDDQQTKSLVDNSGNDTTKDQLEKRKIELEKQRKVHENKITNLNQQYEEENTLAEKLAEISVKINELKQKIEADEQASTALDQKLAPLINVATSRQNEKNTAEKNKQANKITAEEKEAFQITQTNIERLHTRFLEKGEDTFISVSGVVKAGYKDNDPNNEYNQLMSLDSTDNVAANEKKLEEIHTKTLNELNKIENINIDAIKNSITDLHKARMDALLSLNGPSEQTAWNDLQELLSQDYGRGVKITPDALPPFDSNAANQLIAEIQHDLAKEEGFRKNGIRIVAHKGGGIQAFRNDTQSTLAAVSAIILQNPKTSLLISDGTAGQRNIAAKQAFREGAITRILYPDAEGILWNKINSVKRDLKHDKKVFSTSEAEITTLLMQIYHLPAISQTTAERDILFKMIFSAITTDQIAQVLSDLHEQEPRLKKDLQNLTDQTNQLVTAAKAKLAAGENVTKKNVKEEIFAINQKAEAKTIEINLQKDSLPKLREAVLQGLFAAIGQKSPQERATIFKQLELEDKASLFTHLYLQCNRLQAQNKKIDAPRMLSWFTSSNPKNNMADILFKEFVEQLTPREFEEFYRGNPDNTLSSINGNDTNSTNIVSDVSKAVVICNAELRKEKGKVNEDVLTVNIMSH